MQLKRLAVIAVFLLVVASFPVSGAEGYDNAERKEIRRSDAEDVFREGLLKFRNSDYAAAVESFEKYTLREPNDPRGPWMNLKARCMQFRADRKADETSGKKTEKIDDLYYAELMLLADTAIKQVQEKILEEDKVGFYRFVAADALGIKGVFQKANDNWKGGVDTAERMREFAETSDYQDSKYLLGLAEYGLSLMPGLKGWIVRRAAPFYGFPSDREHGLQLIHEAEMDNTGPFADDIRLLMFQILTDTKKLKDKHRRKAEEIFQVKTHDLYVRLKVLYPQNELIRRYEGKTQ
ncbi:MAG: hypothetical protein AAB897_01650 [Patescibacteria group bacterium]